jgi:hypothetical protein
VGGDAVVGKQHSSPDGRQTHAPAEQAPTCYSWCPPAPSPPQASCRPAMHPTAAAGRRPARPAPPLAAPQGCLAAAAPGVMVAAPVGSPASAAPAAPAPPAAAGAAVMAAVEAATPAAPRCC